MEPVLIRKSNWVNSGIAVTAGLFISWYFLGPYDETRIMYQESPRLTWLLGLIFFGLFFYSIRELILKKSEIILTEEGIEIRDEGWNHWTYINSISMLVEKSGENETKEYLVINLKDSTELKCDISDLNRNPGDIVNLARDFKNNASTYKDQ